MRRRWGSQSAKKGKRDRNDRGSGPSSFFQFLFLSFAVEPSVLSVAFLCVLCVKFRKAQHGGHKESRRTTEQPSRNKNVRGANISTVSSTDALPPFISGSSKLPRRSLVRMRPGLSVAIFQDKFLSPFPGIYFTGVDVPLGIHGDRIDPMELPRHPAVVADRTR
jgi:hypothetical protein